MKNKEYKKLKIEWKLVIFFILFFLMLSFVPFVSVNKTNLAPIPGSWGNYDNTGWIQNDGVDDPQVCYLDYNVVHTPSQPSIRMEGPRAIHAPNEVNDDGHRVYPGDRVVFKCWIKTDPSPVGKGAIIGVDLFGTTQRLWEVAPQKSGNDQDNFDEPKTWNYIWVPYGSDWTLIELDFIVPDKEFYVDDYDNLRSPSPQTIKKFIPWLTASYGDGETAHVWFADIELYINPSFDPTPTLVPTAASALSMIPISKSTPIIWCGHKNFNLNENYNIRFF
jgi:hypothetical protein